MFSCLSSVARTAASLIRQRAQFAFTLLQIALIASASACIVDAKADSTDRITELPIHDEISRALGNYRPFALRLSGSHKWAPCTAERSMFAVSCAEFDSVGESLAGRGKQWAERAEQAPGTIDASWSMGAYKIALPGRNSESVDFAIAKLNDGVENDPKNAQLRNDLAVAHLLRAELHSDAMSLFEGLEQIERAVELDPQSPVIAFNQATMLEKLRLDLSANAYWQQYQTLDRGSRWADEAARRAQLIQEQTQRAAERSKVHPQALRENVLLLQFPQWADAVRTGNTNRVDSLDREIRSVSVRLAGMSGDSSMIALSSLLNRRTNTIAHAIAAYDSGAAAFRKGNYGAAEVYLRPVLRLAADPSARALVQWARIMIGFSTMYASRYEAAESILTEIARDATAHSEIALKARAHWGLGLAAARQGNFNVAISNYAIARDLYHQLGERTNEGAMTAQIGDVTFVLGRESPAFNAKINALQAMSEYGDARARTGAFIALGRELVETGLPAAGVAILREAVALAPSSSRQHDLAEATIRLSDAEVVAGRSREGSQHLKDARHALDAVADRNMRSRLEMEINTAEATVLSTDAPHTSLVRLSIVEEYFRNEKLAFDVAAPLAKKARLELRTGDTSAALRDLLAAARSIESYSIQRHDSEAARDRAAARGEIYRDLVALSLARHDTVESFLNAERGRGNNIRTIPTVPEGSAILSYWSLPNETALWIVTSKGMTLKRIAIDEEQLNSILASFEIEMRRPIPRPIADSLSKRLFALLVKPATLQVPKETAVTIVAQAQLGRLAFAALRDSSGASTGHYFPISYRAKASAAQHRNAGRGGPLIVGNPDFDAQIFSELAPLPHANAEIEGLAQLYTPLVSLTEKHATREALLAALPNAAMLHFAGHARVVESVPRLSHLVLARAPGDLKANSLSAEDISALNLKSLRLVVLSACGTTQRRSRRDAGQSGLASAFLSAGAAGVVSSLWDVDDMQSARLMKTLHVGLAAGKNPATALRDAQLAMEASLGRDASVATWAAFRFDAK